MKIGIIGSYGGKSIGDEAILKGLLCTLNNANKTISEICIFTASPDQTRKIIGEESYKFKIKYSVYRDTFANEKLVSQKGKIKFRQQLIKKMKDYVRKTKYSSYYELVFRKISKKKFVKNNLFNSLDCLIFGGGNVFMDLYPTWPYIMKEIVDQCHFKKIPVYFLGIGAGPIKTQIGKKVFSNLSQNYYVSVRDKESKDLLEKICNKNIILNYDLAFGIYNDIENINQVSVNKIGLTVVPYFAEYYWPGPNEKIYQTYCNNMALLFDELMKLDIEYEFFATNYPTDITAAKDIIKLMKFRGKIRLLEKELDIDELLKYLSTKDFVIGTRLHSIILSTITGKRTFGISYQPKVQNFLKNFGKEKSINIDLFHKDLSIDEIRNISKQIEMNFYECENNKAELQYAKRAKKSLINEIENLL